MWGGYLSGRILEDDEKVVTLDVRSVMRHPLVRGLAKMSCRSPSQIDPLGGKLTTEGSTLSEGWNSREPLSKDNVPMSYVLPDASSRIDTRLQEAKLSVYILIRNHGQAESQVSERHQQPLCSDPSVGDNTSEAPHMQRSFETTRAGGCPEEGFDGPCCLHWPGCKAKAFQTNAT